MYEFGDKLLYQSPYCDWLQTPCVFIRDDNGKAVIMFAHAEWCARVSYNNLISKSDRSFGEIVDPYSLMNERKDKKLKKLKELESALAKELKRMEDEYYLR